MKLRHDTVFISVLLCLTWPIGLIFLIKAPKPFWMKVIMACSGLLIFIALFFPSFFHSIKKPTLPEEFELTATRTELNIGQSGGLSLTNGNYYYTDFTAKCNNETLTIRDNIYTANKCGTCTIEVTYKDKVKTIDIIVSDRENTASTVYASPTGERYHATQKHAGQNGVPCTEEEALLSGKTPCKICW